VNSYSDKPRQKMKIYLPMPKPRTNRLRRIVRVMEKEKGKE